jgi:iron complex outermembrane recepter protein
MKKSMMFTSYASILVAVGMTPAFGADQTAKKEASGESALEEVVVTATKRNENLLKVPITVNVLTAKDIEAAGITRAADFLNSTPNVSFSEDNTGETFIGIRGQTTSRNSDPNVAIVVDGVTLTSVRDFNQDLFDLEQIEVLKGPQSALRSFRRRADCRQGQLRCVPLHRQHQRADHG